MTILFKNMKHLILFVFILFGLNIYAQERWDTTKVVMLISDTTTTITLGKKTIINASNVYMIFGYKVQHADKPWRTIYLTDDKTKLNKKYIVWYIRPVLD